MKCSKNSIEKKIHDIAYKLQNHPQSIQDNTESQSHEETFVSSQPLSHNAKIMLQTSNDLWIMAGQTRGNELRRDAAY